MIRCIICTGICSFRCSRLPEKLLMENNVETNLEKVPAKKKATWITLRLILALVLFIATLVAFVGIADEIVLEHDTKFDQTIFLYVHSFVSPALTHFMEVITFFGSAQFLFPAYSVLIILYLIRKKSRLALDITMIGLSSTGILFFLKDIFRRHRPVDPIINHVAGFSFPSGHSFSSFTFFGLLIYIAWHSEIKRSWKIAIAIVLIAFAAIIAFSRVYLRVHYASDILAGFCLSVVWLMLALWLLHKADRGLATAKK